jgi:predicted HicB family RNase H-like nuclease
MISKDSARAIVSMPKELKRELEQRAENENRSLNNYIVTVLKQHIEKPVKK